MTLIFSEMSTDNLDVDPKFPDEYSSKARNGIKTEPNQNRQRPLKVAI